MLSHWQQTAESSSGNWRVIVRKLLSHCQETAKLLINWQETGQKCLTVQSPGFSPSRRRNRKSSENLNHLRRVSSVLVDLKTQEHKKIIKLKYLFLILIYLISSCLISFNLIISHVSSSLVVFHFIWSHLMLLYLILFMLLYLIWYLISYLMLLYLVI